MIHHRNRRLMVIGILCVILFSFCSLFAYGAGETIRCGSPRIDGEMDAIYRDSCLLTLQEEGFYSWGKGSSDGICAECRVLWDESFLYLCTVVQDSTILSVGRENAAGCRENDCVTYWFTDGGVTFSVQADPFGYAFTAENGKPTFRMANAVCAARYYPEQNYYVIEMALPFESLIEGRELGISLQVNDLAESDSGTSYASSVICAENIFSLSGETASPVTELPESGQDSPVTPGPPTSDTILVFLLAAVVAVVVILLLIRRRK